MNRYLIGFLLLFFTTEVSAGIEIEDFPQKSKVPISKLSKSNKPSFKPSVQKKAVFLTKNENNLVPLEKPKLPVKLASPKPLSITVHEGSLHDTLEDIVKHAGWEKMVWNLPCDYQWLGSETIYAANLEGVLEKLLANYPVQAVFYQENRVIVISPRNIG